MQRTHMTGLTQEVEDDLYKKFVQDDKGRVFGLGGQLVWKEHGESSSSFDSPPNPPQLVEDVAEINKQLAAVLEFIQTQMPEGAMEEFMSQRLTQVTGNSVTGSIQSIAREYRISPRISHRSQPLYMNKLMK